MKLPTIDRIIEVIGKVPTTNARIVVTIVIWFLTGLAVVGDFIFTKTWEAPPWEWTLALSVMMGLDTIQYLGKRKTFQKFAGDESANESTEGGK